MRELLYAAVLVGVVGLGAELVLLEHWAEAPQLVPFVTLALGLAATVAVWARPGRGSVRAFQGAMALFVAVGAVGIALHYRGNALFELEMDASASGWGLVKLALFGATPLLAPGALVQTGLVGLVATFRHPALRASRSSTKENSMRSSPKHTLALAGALLLSAACGDAGEEAAPAGDAPVAVESAAPAPETTAAEGAFLDPNAASREELLGVPGIDEALADAVIAGRPYQDMRGVDAVLAESLDETRRDSVYTALWLPLDLNTATEEEILLIPGVGDRMAHEFEEYRPYRGIEQFRREIGKYVDEAEVARLERYVTIR